MIDELTEDDVQKVNFVRCNGFRMGGADDITDGPWIRELFRYVKCA